MSTNVDCDPLEQLRDSVHTVKQTLEDSTRPSAGSTRHWAGRRSKKTPASQNPHGRGVGHFHEAFAQHSFRASSPRLNVTGALCTDMSHKVEKKHIRPQLEAPVIQRRFLPTHFRLTFQR